MPPDIPRICLTIDLFLNLVSEEFKQYTNIYVSIAREHSLECLREYVNTPVPDIPTLFFVSDGSVMSHLMDADTWISIHEDYINGLTNGVIIYLDCGHYVHVERPDEVASGIEAFADSL